MLVLTGLSLLLVLSALIVNSTAPAVRVLPKQGVVEGNVVVVARSAFGDKMETKEIKTLIKLKKIQEILDSVEECWERENMLGFLRGWIWKQEAKENARAERKKTKEKV